MSEKKYNIEDIEKAFTCGVSMFIGYDYDEWCLYGKELELRLFLEQELGVENE